MELPSGQLVTAQQVLTGMALQSYSYVEEATKREIALICALEVIRANCVGASSLMVKEHLQNLDMYVDSIEAALKQ